MPIALLKYIPDSETCNKLLRTQSSAPTSEVRQIAL